MDLATLGLIATILGGLATVVTYLIKRKENAKENQDALGTVEADELGAGMDRVDAANAASLRNDKKG